MNSLEMEIAIRLSYGEKFTHFERADERGWKVGIGPISDFLTFAETTSEEAAGLITKGLNLALSPAPVDRNPKGGNEVPSRSDESAVTAKPAGAQGESA